MLKKVVLWLSLVFTLKLSATPNTKIFMAPILEQEGSIYTLEFQVKKHLKSKNVLLLEDAYVTRELRKSPAIPAELKIKIVEEKIKSDFYIFVKSGELNGRKNIEFEVFDIQRQRVYYKQKMVNLRDTIKEDDLRVWIDDFFLTMPNQGMVVSKKDKLVEIKFNRFINKDELGNGYFEVFDKKDYKLIGKGKLKSYQDSMVVGELMEEEPLANMTEAKVSLLINAKDKERVTEELTETNRSLIYNNPFKYSMRACTLLPLSGNIPKIEEEYGHYQDIIKESAQCNYRSNEKMLEILKNYGHVDSYVNNKKVLQIVSEKLNIGSLIRMKFDQGAEGLSLIFDIVAENGEDIYFSRSKFLKKYDRSDVKKLIRSWVEEYGKEIPYHGKVVEVLGEKVVIEFDRDSKFQDSQHFIIMRPTNLKIRSRVGVSYVEWSKNEISQGTFTEVTEDYSVGVVRKQSGQGGKVRVGDWILTDNELFLDGETDYLFTRHNVKNKYRKIGRLKIGFQQNKASVTQDNMEKSFVGGKFDFEYYLPYGFLFNLGAKRNLTGDDNYSASGSNLDGALGYSFTPQKKFILSAMDIYFGYRLNSYTFDTNAASVFDQLSFSGPYGAFAFELPLTKHFLIYNKTKYSPMVSAKNTRKKIEVYKDVKGMANSTDLIYILRNDDIGPLINFTYQQFDGTTNAAVDFKVKEVSFSLGLLINY